MEKIIAYGTPKKDRTGTGTISLFAEQLRFNLQDGFPAITTKKLAWKGVVSELLWFIEGSGSERRLAEIRYGKKANQLDDKRTIWTDNANANYWLPKAQFEGDLGRVYGVQWRAWRKPAAGVGYIDQLQQVIENIKEKPYDRRHVVTAWNPGEINEMALPPCHMIFQFYVADNKLSLHMMMRSTDVFLGLPFNIASYALLVHMVAQVTDLEVGELVITCNDCHIYQNHIDAVKTQLSRSEFLLPELLLNKDIKNIDHFTMNDIVLSNYQSHDSIRAEMAV